MGKLADPSVDYPTLPRSPSRGLIEAGGAARLRPATGALFPGHQAGASLKQLLDHLGPLLS